MFRVFNVSADPRPYAGEEFALGRPLHQQHVVPVTEVRGGHKADLIQIATLPLAQPFHAQSGIPNRIRECLVNPSRTYAPVCALTRPNAGGGKDVSLPGRETRSTYDTPCSLPPPLSCGKLILNWNPIFRQKVRTKTLARHRSTPRHKRLSQQSRLQAAQHWLAQYPGTNLLRGYRKHFGVDFECAVKELSLLGITFDVQYISQVRQSLYARQEHRRSRRQALLNGDKARHEEWSFFLQGMGIDYEAHEEPPTDISKGH